VTGALSGGGPAGGQGGHAFGSGGHTAGEGTGTTGAPDEPNRSGAVARRPRRTTPTHLALLRLDLEALLRGRVEGDELCEISGLGPVPVRIARQLLGDAVLKLVLTRGVDVANVTHLGRGPSGTQRTAMLWGFPTCVVQGCHAVRTEADHRVPWKETRHTRLGELDALCGHHHDLKTYEGWALVAGTGRRPMVAPNDPRHPGHGASAGSERAPPDGKATSPAPTLFGS
jgi:hypothetical protein